MTCPGNISTNQTSVTWRQLTADDNGRLTSGVICSPDSGEVFSLGQTPVRCYATDEAGNVGECSFIVAVGKKLLFLQ